MSRSSEATVPVIVCADDFGLNPAVNDAVIELLARRRVSAVSCLVDAPAAADGARQLRPLARETFDLGLHLNLTESWGDGWPPMALPALLARACARVLDLSVVRAEVRRQLTRFEDLHARAPAHVDGHQHVHQLPGVRQVLMEELRARYDGDLPWLRVGRRPPGEFALKAVAIDLLGAKALARAAARQAFGTNARLLGVYGFKGSPQDYLRRLDGWLYHARPYDLLMCHPARNADAHDPIAEARGTEYRVLAGEAFGVVMSRRWVVTSRLPRRNGELALRQASCAPHA